MTTPLECTNTTNQIGGDSGPSAVHGLTYWSAAAFASRRLIDATCVDSDVFYVDEGLMIDYARFTVQELLQRIKNLEKQAAASEANRVRWADDLIATKEALTRKIATDGKARNENWYLIMWPPEGAAVQIGDSEHIGELTWVNGHARVRYRGHTKGLTTHYRELGVKGNSKINDVEIEAFCRERIAGLGLSWDNKI